MEGEGANIFLSKDSGRFSILFQGPGHRSISWSFQATYSRWSIVGWSQGNSAKSKIKICFKMCRLEETRKEKKEIRLCVETCSSCVLSFHNKFLTFFASFEINSKTVSNNKINFTIWKTNSGWNLASLFICLKHLLSLKWRKTFSR